MPEKPAILIIPGGFSLPLYYDAVVEPLRAQGYQIEALHLPSIGYKSTTPLTMFDDASFIASETSKLVEQGKDVIIISHSYGGVPATQSTKGLGKKERQKEGKQGGVVRIGYATAMVPSLDGTEIMASSDMDVLPKEHRVEMRIDDDGWLHQSDLESTAAIVFSDMPKEEGEKWASKATRHSSLTFPSEITHAGYRNIPISWLLCEDDLCIPASHQKGTIAMIEKESGQKVDVTAIKAGHCPFISKPQVVVDWVLDMVAKV